MLKKGRELVQRVADAIAPPAMPDAQRAVDDRARALSEAQAAVRRAEIELESAFDRRASARELAEIEARRDSAEIDAKRAQGFFQAAEKTLERVRERDAAKAREVGGAEVRALVVEREQAGADIDVALLALAAGVARLDAADERLAPLQNAGHLTSSAAQGLTFGPGATRGRLDAAFQDLNTSGDPMQRAGSFEQWARVVSDLNKPREPVKAAA